MMVGIQAHDFPPRSPAPRPTPETPNTTTVPASKSGPLAIPERTDAPPNRESKPPAIAITPTMVTPTGLFGFRDDDVVSMLFIPLSCMDKFGGVSDFMVFPVSIEDCNKS